MYFDEDGDLAHEFYEEVMPNKHGGVRRMRKVSSKQLLPQGDVQVSMLQNVFFFVNDGTAEKAKVLFPVKFLKTG
jgi:hypothetical protein